jgi:competence protein ComGC
MVLLALNLSKGVAISEMLILLLAIALWVFYWVDGLSTHKRFSKKTTRRYSR